jgi:rfaE bifunctional protein nucleotidyltransferase chain/domain
MLNLREKIICLEQVADWRETLRQSKQRLVVTNGCFDLLHAGHVFYLEAARNLGDALLVGVNGDEAVRELKGLGRPITPAEDRAAVLAGLEAVTAATIFQEMRATRFLALAQPDVYVKGGDYTLDTLNQEERQTVEKAGGEIVIVPFISGRSTSGLAGKILRL